MLYLRLNGFFTSGLVLHSHEKGRVRGDVDCLAIRHPFHDQAERGVNSDPFLELSAATELLICEVKSSPSALSFNGRLKSDAAALNALLRWAGVVRPELINDVVRLLTPLLQDDVTWDAARTGVCTEGVRIRALLCCPNCPPGDSAGRWFIEGETLLNYVNSCLNPHVPRPSCSTSYPYELWGGYLEPLVMYFKRLPTATTPTFPDLRARVAGRG